MWLNFLSILFLLALAIYQRKKVKKLQANLCVAESSLRDLEQKFSLLRSELEGICSSIPESLVILDEGGRIVFWNENFKRLAGGKELKGKFHWEVLRNLKFREMVEELMKGKGHLVLEIEHEGRFYRVKGKSFSSGDKFLFIFQDITELKRLEQVKKDFVANVSHELRTPLTAIMGYLETLEEELKEDRRHYLEVAKKHTQRLINIIQDLLLLSELEEKRTPVVEEVNLEEVLDHVLQLFRSRAEEKGLILRREVSGHLLIKGDALKLEQLLINLIDNAIKYTEEGEVKVCMRKEGENVKIEVEDTGIGIPSEHQDRIFERFYVVDKSRSRRGGGTGLGLSIVKHIVLLHKGKIQLQSTPGKGSKFIIILPCNLS